MDNLFSRYWWLFLVRGIFAVILGLLALFMPVAAFTTLVIFLGVYMFIDGIFSIISALGQRKTNRNWAWLLLTGIFGVLIGIITFYNPFATAAGIIYLLSFWALIIGIAEIAWAIRLRKVIEGEGWYIFFGLLTVLFSLLVLFNPLAGVFVLSVMFGSYLLIIGAMLITLAIRLKRRNTRLAV